MLTVSVISSGSLLAPLPLILTGLAPFAVGTMLGGVSGFPLRLGVCVAGLVAVAFLIAAAFASREVFAPNYGRYPGWGLPSPVAAGRLASFCLAMAALIGLLLQFWWHTGDLTIPLGGLGGLGGYFSFAPPLHWQRRGWGEGVGGLCFGLLPVVTGLYLQCGHLLSEVLLYGLPLTCTGFNLFLINGFPDQGSNPAPYSLPARLGPVAGALLYTIFNILTITGLVFILVFPGSPLPWRAVLVPLALLAVVNQELIKRKAYRDESRLQLVCRLTLTLHLGMGLAFISMLWQRL